MDSVKKIKIVRRRASLVVQQLRVHLANAGGMGSVPGLGRFHMLQGN